MDARQLDALAQRLVQNPHDEEALAQAHEQGQADPRAYAMLLEKVGTISTDPAYSAHWLTEAANVWSTALGDAHRAARALMTAIERDPAQATAAERLAALYREKGDTKALIALLERRAKALAPLAEKDPDLRVQASSVHEELGRIWAEPPLSQQKKAVENFKKAIEYDATTQYAIYALRELYKANADWAAAVPYFEMEQLIVTDNERKLALYQDEAEVRRSAGDLAGAVEALKKARVIEGGEDPALKQQVATLVLERVQANEQVAPAERAEAAALLIQLAEAYPGEHGYSYSACAVDLEPTNDRAVQLVMYYAEQLDREAEAAPKVALYLRAHPAGVMAEQARALVSRMIDVTGDDSMLESLAPPPGAADSDRIRALLEIAQALARKAKKTEAAERYREVVSIDPGNLDAVAFLEGFLRQTRKFQELKELLLAAAKSSTPEESQRLSWLKEAAALSETQLRDVDGAVTTLERVVELDPSDEEAAGSLERLLEKAARWDDLAGMLESRSERLSDVEARLSLEKQVAKIHEQHRKDLVGAGRAWARIAALTPEDETAVESAVEFFERGNRPDLAAQALAELAANVSDDRARADLFQKLGELRKAAGDVLGAGEAFAESASISKRSERWHSAEDAFVLASAWDQAATAADEQSESAGDDVAKAALSARVAQYLEKAGDTAGAVMRLEQANDLDPKNEDYAALLEGRYSESERYSDLAALLLRRAPKLDDIKQRSALRKRAAQIQRGRLSDADAARLSLTEVLEDAEDPEALSLLADDAVGLEDYGAAVEYLDRLAKVTDSTSARADVLLRAAGLIAEHMSDTAGAIDRYEAILELEGVSAEQPLRKLAAQHEKLDDPKGTASAFERLLQGATTAEQKLEFARKLAELYENSLDDAVAAARVLTIVTELDSEDYNALGRLCALFERLEDWESFVKHLTLLVEVEADDDEVSRMTRRLAEVYHQKLGKSDEALAVLLAQADLGSASCREEYVTLGDELGWKGIVAQKLVEWNVETPAGPQRNAALQAAFRRFVDVGRDVDAAQVAKELARTRGAEKSLSRELEKIGIKLKDLDALGIAHDLQAQDLSGPARAEELVRQAEVLKEAGVEAAGAVQHGEQGLVSVAADEAEALLVRLAKLTDEDARIVDLYERQVTRCKAPSDRLRALARAAQVAAEHEALPRARVFLDIALGGGLADDALTVLVRLAREADARMGGLQLTRTLAEAMAAGGQGARDGGRTRAALLGQAAELAFNELKDTEQAFQWVGDSLVAHVDDERLDLLTKLADDVGEPARAHAVLTRALEEVFDGPLVRKLLDRRAQLLLDRQGNPQAAADDLKRLHDLSPSDTSVMERLSALYTQLRDFRGMVELYEDQILRGKDPTTRLDLARKVARLWEEQLDDPREAADAWRRVLRMKAGDPEGTEGLDRAKSNMLKRPKTDSDEGAKAAIPAKPAPAPAPAPKVEGKDEPSKPVPAAKESPKPAVVEELPANESASSAASEAVSEVVQSTPESEPAAAEATKEAETPAESSSPPEPPVNVSEATAPSENRLKPPPKNKKKKRGKGRSQPPPEETVAPSESISVETETVPSESEPLPEAPFAGSIGLSESAESAASNDPAASNDAVDADAAVSNDAVVSDDAGVADAAAAPETGETAKAAESTLDELEVEVEEPKEESPPPSSSSSRRVPPPPPSSRHPAASAPSSPPSRVPPPPPLRSSRRPPPPPPSRASRPAPPHVLPGGVIASPGPLPSLGDADDDLLVDDEELLE